MAEAHFSPGDDCPQTIAKLFESAKIRVDVCVFTITDDRIASAILRAHRRGVQIRIITDNEKASDLGSDIERLAEAGLAVVVDESPYHMHHKYALFDDALLLTGSYNWTRSAAEFNQENFILSEDEALLTSFRSHFEKLWRQLKG